jgi:hypothetical protein
VGRRRVGPKAAWRGRRRASGAAGPNGGMAGEAETRAPARRRGGGGRAPVDGDGEKGARRRGDAASGDGEEGTRRSRDSSAGHRRGFLGARVEVDGESDKLGQGSGFGERI